MLQKRRHRLFVDFRLQGNLLFRTTLYWLYCLLAIAFVAACWILWAYRPESSAKLIQAVWVSLGPACLGSLILLPLVLMDCLRLSNRFAGPMVRFRKAMKALADDEPTPVIRLRDGDYWKDFAEDLNRLIEKQALASDAPPPRSVVAAAPQVPAAELSASGGEKTSTLNVYSESSV